MKDVLAYSS
nr:unnamed protein product [Callosobruchus analis]